MAEPAVSAAAPPAEEVVESASVFTVHERRETDKAVFVYTTYHGDVGPPAPARLAIPPVHSEDADASTVQTGASALSSVFVMANSTVGAGVLSLPFAFHNTGILGGLLLCVVVGLTEALTLYVLSKFAERYSAVTYVELVRKALGRKLAAVLSAVLIVSMFGACVAYLIILADNLSPLAAAAGLPEWIYNRQHIVAFLGAVVLLPMCMPRQLTALARVNQVAVLGFLFGAGLVAYKGVEIALERPHPMDDVELFRFNYNSLFAIPIVVFGFNCHSMAVSIFHELEPTPGLLLPLLPSSPTAFRRYRYMPRPGTRKLVGMVGVILSSTGLVMVAYVIVGVSGYLAFPDKIDSNILLSLPANDIKVQIARAMITLIVLGSYPLTHHPARSGFEHLVKPATSLGNADPNGPPPGVPLWLSVGFTFLFVLGSTAVAEVVNDLGSVLHLLGGFTISFIIFFLPGLLLINAAIVKHSTHVLESLEQQAEEAQVVEEIAAKEAAAGATTSNNLSEPLLMRLQSAKAKGIKKSGLIYAPRLSWLFGTALLMLSIVVASIALVTVLLGPEES